MTPRSLFNIILKILGIFFIKDFIAFIPQLLSVGLFLTEPDTVPMGILSFVIILLILFAYGVVAYYLVFKTDFIIDKLRLDKDFKEEILPLNIHRSTILSISVIIIGGILAVEEILNFCRLSFSYFQEKRMTFGQTSPTTIFLFISLAKIVIGVLLMSRQKQIVNFIERKRRV